MFYKVTKGTDLYKKCESMLAKMKDYNNQAFELAKELGFGEIHIAYWSIGGGISILVSKKDQVVDEKIYRRYKGWQTKWQVRKNTKVGKALQARLDALPMISYGDFNQELFNKYHMFGHPSMNIISEQGVVVFGFGDQTYEDLKDELNKIPDLIEIKHSEFLMLQGQ